MTADPDPSPGRVGPTAGPALAVCAVIGLVLGWLVRRTADALGQPAPLIGWGPALVLAFFAAAVGCTAWLTKRQIRDRVPILAHRAVNRLVLAKASALVGALAAGGYVGHAISWLGVPSPAAEQRIGHSLLAAAAGGLLTAAAIALERACRVRIDGPDDLG